MALKRSKLRLDSPVNNFATWNPLAKLRNLSLSDGNLKSNKVNSSDNTDSGHGQTAISSIAIPTVGKWYAEIRMITTATAAASRTAVGILDQVAVKHKQNWTSDFAGGGSEFFYSNAGTGYAYNASGHKTSTPGTFESYSETYGNNDIISIFYDADNGTLTFYKNGSNKGIAFTGITGQYYFATGYWGDFIANFGQNPDFCGQKTDGGRHSDANGRGEFYYKPPWGALALCSANLTAAMDEKPSQNFKAITYHGNDEEKVEGVGFKPDLVWVKARDNDSWNHQIHDSVRGASDGMLATNSANQSDSNYHFDSFDDDGFTTNSGNITGVNNSGNKFVAWTWKAGGAPEGENTAMVDGVETTVEVLTQAAGASCTPEKMSVNTQAGFSIVKYIAPGVAARQTLPHGLNKVPEIIIQKDLDNTNNWHLWASSIFGSDNSKVMILQTTGAESSYSDSNGTVWNSIPTTTTFGTGHNSSIGAQSIAYCWHSVPGYSAFGKYTANDSTDGPFVYTGFKPAFIMVKVTNIAGDSWVMLDSSREEGIALYADKRINESDSNARNDRPVPVDFLSNGFKFRINYSEVNGASSGTNHELIYMAFAEKPPTVPEKVKYNTSKKERHSLRFDGSSYLSRTPTTAGNRKTWTWSGWVKLGLFGQTNGMCLFSASSGSTRTRFYHHQNSFLYLDLYNGTSYPLNVKSENLLRDSSAFNHIVVVVDTSTNPTRIEYYVNGVEVAYQSSKSLPVQNTPLNLNDTTEHLIGAIDNYTRKFHGYLSNIHFIDGVACSADYFGKYKNGKWVAKEYEGSYGKNGFRLDFAPDNMEYRADGTLEIVKDSSGNGNHWTAST